MFGLEAFSVKERVVIDLETISYDDDVEALNPYAGHKISTIIIAQNGVPTKAFPLRNRNNKSNLLLPLDDFMKEFRDFAAEVLVFANQNIKFDLRFFACDNVFFPKARFEDTPVLARLINNDLQSYSLESLVEEHKIPYKKSPEVRNYLRQIGSKDYGAAPVDMLMRYGVSDGDATLALHNLLLAKLPEETLPVWEEECKICRVLFNLEHRGILIDKKFLQRRSIVLLSDMIGLAKKIQKETNGVINNPGSSSQVDVYMKQQGIEPVAYNDPTEKMISEGKTQGNPSWSSEALEQINHPVARLIVKYKDCQTQESMFCKSWVREADGYHRVHPDFRSSGTKTGRISAAEPNVYNPPKWCMEAILIPNGYIGVKFDKKQIEYRLFAHYSGDENLINQYAIKPDIDYHQILADLLGIPRDPTKTINFGILYGMGKPKLKRRLSVQFAEIEHEWMEKVEAGKCKLEKAMQEIGKVRAALRKYLALAGYTNVEKIVGETGPINPKVFDVVAEEILKEYKTRVPAIDKLQSKVKSVVKSRGYIRNYYGRRYYYPPQFAYIATNALIQGTAADFFKKKINEIDAACDPRVELIDMIYDSYFAIMPYECAQDFWMMCKRIVADAPFKIPVLIDGEVALGNWHNITKIQNDDVLGSAALVCHLK